MANSCWPIYSPQAWANAVLAVKVFMPFLSNQRIVFLDDPQDFIILVRREVALSQRQGLDPDFCAAVFLSHMHMDVPSLRSTITSRCDGCR